MWIKRRRQHGLSEIEVLEIELEDGAWAAFMQLALVQPAFMQLAAQWLHELGGH